MALPMSYEEMKAKAVELFGENAHVSYNDGWIIETGVEERFDIEKFAGTPAYDAYQTYEATYGSDLDRWAYKNGHDGASMHEVAEAYNAAQERSARDQVEMVRQYIAEGKAFDWEGGPEYRDSVLKLAEEKGW